MTFDAMSNSPSHLQLNTMKFGRRIWLFMKSHLRLFSRHPCNFYIVIADGGILKKEYVYLNSLLRTP